MSTLRQVTTVPNHRNGWRCMHPAIFPGVSLLVLALGAGMPVLAAPAPADPVAHPTTAGEVPASSAMTRPAAGGGPPDRLESTAYRVPERAIFEWAEEAPSGKTRVVLFSNRTAILRTSREGKTGVSHRILSAEELAVYEALVESLFADAGPPGGSTIGCHGELVERTSARMTSRAGATWEWTGCSLGNRPMTAGSIATVANDIAESIREKRRIDDPWRDTFPAVGERLFRSDGLVFVVTAVDDMTNRVDLRASDNQPLSMRLRREELHWLFTLEREERAFNGGTANAPPRF